MYIHMSLVFVQNVYSFVVGRVSLPRFQVTLFSLELGSKEGCMRVQDMGLPIIFLFLVENVCVSRSVGVFVWVGIHMNEGVFL